MAQLAHISDLHLDGTPRATERVRRVMDHLRSLPTPPDALLVTGDIADGGAPAQYRELRGLLAADFPVLVCPGNHDARRALRSDLLGLPPGDGPVNHARRIGDDVLALMCDSSVPGRPDGLLAPETLAWIDDTLSGLEDRVSAVIAFHHPVVPVYHPEPDGIPLRNPGDFAEIVARHPGVVAIVNGHAHTAAASVFAGRPVLLAPAVTWTLVVPFRDDRLGDLDAAPGFAWHTVRDGRITSHFGTVAAPSAGPAGSAGSAGSADDVPAPVAA